MSSITIKDTRRFDTKGVTPKYVDKSRTIVLNQKCIHDGIIDWSFAQYISDDQRIPSGKYVEVGDLLINSTGTGTAGRSAYVSELPEGYKVVIDSHMLVVRFDDKKLSRYFSYFLYSQEERIKTLLIGSSGQGELDKMSVFDIKFPYTKSALASFVRLLDDIDRKISLNRKIHAKLEALARDSYNYWFVQFDFPNANNQPYRTNGGAMVHNEKLKRKIPAGWDFGSISVLGKITGGSTPSKMQNDFFDSNGIAWITPMTYRIMLGKNLFQKVK
jgi:type I restriction enzyme S subunit